MSAGTTLIPRDTINFHRSPVGEAQSSKDFILYLEALKGMYCLNPRLPFHRVWESWDILSFDLQRLLNLLFRRSE
jgi:hypothetical protein